MMPGLVVAAIASYLINGNTSLDVRGNTWMLKKMTGREANGAAVWEVRQQMNVPPAPPGYRYVYTLCSKGGTMSNQIIALAKAEPLEHLSTIRAAWQVDGASDKIEPISPAGVKCYNTRYGVEHAGHGR